LILFNGNVAKTLNTVESLKIEKKSFATLSEIWFNNSIPLNPGLVAVIGNKGKGKSALTDIIGLLGNTRQHRDFTFLSTDNFRQPKDNKAKHFQASLAWASGSTINKGLEELVDERQPKLVNYIPQNFLEKICTQLGKIEESDFDRELKKVIFSHVRDADRLGKSTLDELVAYKTSEASDKIKLLQQELTRINETIIELEEQGRPEHRERIENLLALKKKELESVEKSKPVEVAKPELDPAHQKEISDVSTEIEAAKKKLLEVENQVSQATQEQIAVAHRISVVTKLISRLDNLQRQIQNFLAESEKDLSSVGLSADAILKFEINKQPLLDKNTSFAGQKKALDDQLDPLNKEGFIQKTQQLEAEIEKLQGKLDEPHKKYEAYQAALRSWEKQREIVIGSDATAGTIKFYEARLAELDAVPHKLSDTKNNRLAKAREIHAVIRQLADTYRELYEPVHQFIQQRPLAREKFQLNFEVGIIDTGFRDGFFDIVTQGVAGTFCGIEQGHKMLTDILAKNDFNSEAGTEAFLEEIMTSLEEDKRPGGKPARVADQLRKGKSVLSVYDWIFSLEYLKPRYELRMGTKELSQLSPGERGTLLLVFYLLVDKDDIPLVIDQPEENLDNQTVYELLVPCMKEARQRRQVFIVTHNPNLAVVCDAEQVVCASLDKANNYRMEYLSGSIENPAINKAIVDILEGTRPVFKNRGSKYEVSA
jgi:ABC-type lipoprotein export system ATPase subunit